MKRLPFVLLLVAALVCACGDPEPVEPDPVIDPVDGSADRGSRYFHRTLALDFADYSCSSCPSMMDAVKTAQGMRPGRIVDVLMHARVSAGSAQELKTQLGVNSYPTLLMDLNRLRLTTPDVSRITQYVDAQLANPAQHMGFRIESAPNASGTHIEYHVFAYSIKTGYYHFGVMLVEDDVPIDKFGKDPVVCRSVFRGMLHFTDSEYYLTGGEIWDTRGAIVLGNEIPKDRKLRLVVFAYERMEDGSIRMDNVAQSPLFETLELRFEPY